MILREIGLFLCLSLVAIAALVGWTSAHVLGPDNPIEEDMESYIDNKTGFDIDLTPSTKEEQHAFEKRNQPKIYKL